MSKPIIRRYENIGQKANKGPERAYWEGEVVVEP
ncbi:uncharacterized protein G2W53_006687 [Senna tora]|uniref:Uncharacterized protein n=1 Tax=Senna tora TaxID=362788 RepID=A0A834X598_9FABA|nr:uncharacterized protein G2W53_006687 [Senna tora]